MNWKRTAPHDTIESAAQKFKDELIENVRKQLAENEHILPVELFSYVTIEVGRT